MRNRCSKYGLWAFPQLFLIVVETKSFSFFFRKEQASSACSFAITPEKPALKFYEEKLDYSLVF